MFHETFLDSALYRIKKLIPKSVFHFLAPLYHTCLAYAGAAWYGFPSRSLKVIGVTGTKGKSSTVFFITKILEGAGHTVAAIGSLGYKIKNREWPNALKMTMPGRFKLHKFLYEAKKAGCTHVVLEVTSEGIAQGRTKGITFDCAVFTNLHREHLEAHGSFERYHDAKLELFRKTPGIHVLNADDAHIESFANLPAARKIFFGIERGDIRANSIELNASGSSFEVYGTRFSLHLAGRFNILNALAAMAVGAMYGVDLPTSQPILERIKELPGRMQVVDSGKRGIRIVVDYAHTPDSLRAVYEALKPTGKRLICVLGAAGGGRDKWKRSEFGKIAEEFCDEIILTDEDPYDENPHEIVAQIQSGIRSHGGVHVVMDRREAIRTALTKAQKDDTVIITGKGSETSMALAEGKKIPWSEAQAVRDVLASLGEEKRWTQE